MHHRKLKIPVPPGFFKCPPLSEDEETVFIQQALTSFTTLLRLTRMKGGAVDWTLVEEIDAVKIYQGVPPQSYNDNGSLYMSSTEIQATLEEAAAVMDMSTDAKHKDFCEKFSKDVVDSASLYDLALPTPEHPRNYIGIKWVVYDMPSPLTKNRDMCLLECCDDFVINGRRGWARSFNSVRHGACPDFQMILDLVRMEVLIGGFIFLETDRPGYLEAVQLTYVDVRGKIPVWLRNRGVKNLVKQVKSMEAFFRRKRLTQVRFLSPQELVPTTIRKKCVLCQSIFLPFQPKKNCRKCGEVVCKKCSKHWNVAAIGEHRRVYRICHKCSSDIEPGQLNPLPDQSSSFVGLSRTESQSEQEAQQTLSYNSSRDDENFAAYPPSADYFEDDSKSAIYSTGRSIHNSARHAPEEPWYPPPPQRQPTNPGPSAYLYSDYDQPHVPQNYYQGQPQQYHHQEPHYPYPPPYGQPYPYPQDHLDYDQEYSTVHPPHYPRDQSHCDDIIDKPPPAVAATELLNVDRLKDTATPEQLLQLYRQLKAMNLEQAVSDTA
ncbi:hypothetical protein AeMF1_004109 [Aphanomyces euteiches]|nr:hypothetical protein AeMF1_004109 [Aphanomyces euteiches]KAH9187198.1 hypothetical protein AeNC1_010831 [Aphanomyces euteiches]